MKIQNASCVTSHVEAGRSSTGVKGDQGSLGRLGDCPFVRQDDDVGLRPTNRNIGNRSDQGDHERRKSISSRNISPIDSVL